MRVKLTAKTVETLTSKGRKRMEFWDKILPGFGLRVYDTGRKSWVLLYRFRDRQRRMTIGRYPTFSLAEAREEARTALRAVERGEDPQADKLKSKRSPNVLFPDSVDQFIELYAKPKKTWMERDAAHS